MSKSNESGTWKVLALAAVCWACGGGGAPPLPDLNAAEPQVAERVREANDELQSDPSSSERWGRLGVIYDLHRFTPEAVACYEQAIELDPEEWRWSYFLGLVQLDVDRVAARAAFQRAAELSPDYPPLRFYLGFTAFQDEDLAGAKEQFDRALELDAGLVNAQLGLTRVALARGDNDTAFQLALGATRVAPDEAAVYHHLAQVYRNLGQTELAELTDRMAVSSPVPTEIHGFATLPDPVRADVILREGVSSGWLRTNSRTLLSQGRGQEAIDALRGAVRANPDATGPRLDLARTLAAVGQIEPARMELQAILATDADDAAAHVEMANILARGGQVEPAVAAFRRAIEIDPELHDVRGNLGALLVGAGRRDEGLELLRTASEALPGNADAQYNLAAALARTEQPDEALGVLRTLIERRPDYAPAYELVGTLHAVAGRLDESVAALQRLVEVRPDHAGGHAALGRSLWELGRYEEALAAYQEAMRRNPRDPEVARQLAWALATCPRAGLRDGRQALGIAERLCSASGFQHPMHLDLLAAAQAETGEFGAAVETIAKSLEIVERTLETLPSGEQRTSVEQLRGELRARESLYKRQKPFHERG